jgi:hypothetical protein
VCLALALALVLVLVLALREASFSDLLARFQVATSLKELGRLHPPAPSWHMSISKVVVKLNRPRGGGLGMLLLGPCSSAPSLAAAPGEPISASTRVI